MWPKLFFILLVRMIVILYDSECHFIDNIAQKIKYGLERENAENRIMTLQEIDETVLDSAKCILFGCKSGFVKGVSEGMLKFMNQTYDRFRNQAWKNKLASGFTTDTGEDPKRTIEDLCNFTATHSMLWISQGQLANNEGAAVFFGSSITRVNTNNSYLGCITKGDMTDLTAECFGIRIAQRVKSMRNTYS